MAGLRDLTAGFVLGRYELVLRIAKGGMGEIWAARSHGSRGFQKLVAIKTLLPELSQDPNFEQMFLDEASLAARIKHPNVVEVIDLGDEDQVLYQVMEWVDGASLWAVMRAAARRKEKALPLAIAAGIIHQVCAGLHAAHELRDADGNLIGLVHRDVSPQNVLITPQGVAKVVDFGVARFAGRGGAATQVGELRGKVPYMAPEHIRTEEIDRRVDVFAIGLVFYQLLSGVHPFMGDSDALTLTRIAGDAPAVPLRERVPEISEELSGILDDALKKSPAERIATAALLMQRIERAVPGAGTATNRDEVAAFCHGLGKEHFPARAQELRDAQRRLDNPISRPSYASLSSRESIPQFLESPVTGSTTTSGSATGPERSIAAPLEQPTPPRRGWLLVGGAAAVISGVLAGTLAWRSGASPAPSVTRPLTTVPIAAAPPASVSAEPAAEVPSASASAATSAAPSASIAAAITAPSAAIVVGAAAASAKPRKTGKIPDKSGEFVPGGL